MAAILSVRICSSPLVTSFSAGPELLAKTTWGDTSRLDQQEASRRLLTEAAHSLTSVPLWRSSLTKGMTPRMMSTPLLSTKNKAHL